MDSRLAGLAFAAFLLILGWDTASAAAHAHSGIRRGAEIPPAYESAARRAGISPTLLWAIALQESGVLRGAREVPWPWTLNLAGTAARFTTRERACSALHRALEKISPRLIDVGLAQVNWGYHGSGFRSPCQLLDPYRNLEVACQFLVQLHRPDESWLQTAARYHRPAGGDEASRYASRLNRRLTSLESIPEHRTPRSLTAMTGVR
jgi:soluble lytic murein transglycosylase-like protein